MEVQFVKMHGVGNDFMVARWPDGASLPDGALVRRLADRRLGVGFDQLLILGEADAAQAEVSYRVFNADGSEVEQCGNGVRCVARYLAQQINARRIDAHPVRLLSPVGVVEARVLDDGLVSVNLGEPDFDPRALPFAAEHMEDRYRLASPQGELEFGAVSVGNPHVVLAVDSVEDAPVGILGPVLQSHPAFPSSVNVGFMEVQRAERIRLRVFERGAGETLACGTGAAAAVAVGRRWGVLADTVVVSLPGGELQVQWQGPGTPLWLTGQTTWVYEGRIQI